MDNKIEKKKQKIKELIFDYQEKEVEVERMKEEMQSLRDKTRLLNRKIKDERRKSQHKSSVMNQNCDFEQCMEEDCVEPL